MPNYIINVLILDWKVSLSWIIFLGLLKFFCSFMMLYPAGQNWKLSPFFSPFLLRNLQLIEFLWLASKYGLGLSKSLELSVVSLQGQQWKQSLPNAPFHVQIVFTASYCIN